MFGSGPIRLLDPKVGRHLIADEGEVVIDEVRHHWVVFTVPMLEVIGAVILLFAMVWLPLDAAGAVLLIVLVLLGHAFWIALKQHRDRFVVTNMRVMRIHGVFSQRIATTPIMRILDITVDIPFNGRMFGYGHFVFESAAQDQGLRDIRFVSRPTERDLTIQRVIQRSGLRASADLTPVDDDDDGTGPQGIPSSSPTPTPSQPHKAHPVSQVIFSSEGTDWADPFDTHHPED